MMFAIELHTQLLGGALILLIGSIMLYIMLLTTAPGQTNRKVAFHQNAKKFISRFYNQNKISKTKIQLSEAQRHDNVYTYLYVRIVAPFALAIIVFFLSFNVLIAVVVGLATKILLEVTGTTLKIEKRRKALEKDALPFYEVLTLSVQSGSGLEKAIELTCDKFRDSAIKDEFKLVLATARHAVSLKEALVAMNNRVPSMLIKQINVSIINGLDMGSTMDETMSREIIRVRQMILDKAEEMAAKTGAKIFIPLVLTMLPAILIILLSPIVMRVMGSL